MRTHPGLEPQYYMNWFWRYTPAILHLGIEASKDQGSKVIYSSTEVWSWPEYTKVLREHCADGRYLTSHT